MLIRTAVTNDAPALGELKVRSWRSAYAGFMSREFLGALDPVREAGGWAEYLAAVPDEHRLWVAEEEGAVLGFCRTGPADADRDLGAGAAEIFGLYIEPVRIGTGLGRSLFGHGTADLETRGYGPLCVYAYLPNEGAMRFYERAGFVRDGVTRRDDDLGVAEARLVRPVDKTARKDPAIAELVGRLTVDLNGSFDLVDHWEDLMAIGLARPGEPDVLVYVAIAINGEGAVISSPDRYSYECEGPSGGSSAQRVSYEELVRAAARHLA